MIQQLAAELHFFPIPGEIKGKLSNFKYIYICQKYKFKKIYCKSIIANNKNNPYNGELLQKNQY